MKRKELSSSAISTEPSCNGDSKEETLNVNKTCWQNIKCWDIKYIWRFWRRFSLPRHLFNVKHHAPSKSMSSKYRKTKIFGNCFQNMNLFSWIKLIPVLIHLKYWYYNPPYPELSCLPHYFYLNSTLLTETPL